MNLHVHECITSLAVGSLQPPKIVSSLLFILRWSVTPPCPHPPSAFSLSLLLQFSGVGVELVGLPEVWHCYGGVVSWKILQWPSNKELGAALPSEGDSKARPWAGPTWLRSLLLKLQCEARSHVGWACGARGAWAAVSEYSGTLSVFIACSLALDLTLLYLDKV